MYFVSHVHGAAREDSLKVNCKPDGQVCYFCLMNWWHSIINYYETIGRRYHVDPVIFLGIHLVGTPLFSLTVWWIIRNKRKHRPMGLSVCCAALVYNAANIYLIGWGRAIPWWIYTLVGLTTVITGYFTVRAVRGKLRQKQS